MHVSEYASFSFEVKYVIFVVGGSVCVIFRFGFVLDADLPQQPNPNDIN
jgi:hypothetical protein